MTGRVALTAVILGVICLALFLASLSLGPVPVSSGTAAKALLGLGDPATVLILQQIRLPRAILAVVIGAGLGVSGAALQALLRNPLADPGVTGISSAAGLGAVIAFYSGLAAAFPLALPLAAMLGALAAVALLFGLAGPGSGILTVILAGAGINALAGALTSLVLNLAPSPFAIAEIVFWLLGSLSDRSMDHVWLAAPPITLGILVLTRTSHALDALMLGDEVALSLGFPTGRTRWLVIAGTTLAVAPGVAVAGTIGFVGLAVPHLLRPIVGHRPSRVLGVSALAGAALVLASDLIVRLVPSPGELKLGVVTSMVGAPFFLVLLLRLRRRGVVHG